MKRVFGTGATALLLCFAGSLPAAAQDGAVPLPPPVEGAIETASEAFDALSAEMRTAQTEWRREYSERRAAAGDGGWDAPPRVEPEFQQRFAEAAEYYAGSEDAVPFLLTVASLGRSADKDLALRAVETLASDRVESAKLSQLTFTLMYATHLFGEQGVELTATRIAEATPHADVKAAMLFLRGSLIQRRGAADEDEAATAVADLRAAADAAPDSRYAGLALGSIFELENLQIGMVAPEIEGADLDGVAFKLSDYRGKVVVLDFWGDW
jgi:hypothetical protein